MIIPVPLKNLLPIGKVAKIRSLVNLFLFTYSILYVCKSYLSGENLLLFVLSYVETFCVYLSYSLCPLLIRSGSKGDHREMAEAS